MSPHAIPLPTPYIERGRDKTETGMVSVGLHVGLFLLIWFGASLVPKQVIEAAGEPIEAILIDLPKAPMVRPQPAAPKPKPVAPAPTPAPKPETTPASRPEDVTDLKPPAPPIVEPDALSQEDPLVMKRRQEEEQRRQQLEKIQKERELLQKKQEEAKKQLAEAQARKEQQETKQREIEEKELADKIAAEEAASLRGTQLNDDLMAQYVSVLTARLDDAWLRPNDSRTGVRCQVKILQIPGGEVIDKAIVGPCAADPMLRESMLMAVDRASPLPYAGFEKVFAREIIVPMNSSGVR